MRESGKLRWEKKKEEEEEEEEEDMRGWERNIEMRKKKKRKIHGWDRGN